MLFRLRLLCRRHRRRRARRTNSLRWLCQLQVQVQVQALKEYPAAAPTLEVQVLLSSVAVRQTRSPLMCVAFQLRAAARGAACLQLLQVRVTLPVQLTMSLRARQLV